jgi:hypothetical protein
MYSFIPKSGVIPTFWKVFFMGKMTNLVSVFATAGGSSLSPAEKQRNRGFERPVADSDGASSKTGVKVC